MSNLTQSVKDIINDRIRKALDDYYRNRDAESFFKLVAYMDSCNSMGLTREDIPCFIEMQNVIVMG